MSIKMEKVQQHPHMYIADFVNKYFELIKPFLEKGDVETANVGVYDVYFRANKAFEDAGIVDWKNGTYERYFSTIQKLKALVDSKISSKRVLDSILLMINRDIAELEIILQDDEIYKKFRQREKI